MSSPVADQYQVDEFNYGPPPASFFTGPAARQIQNPQHIFMNYPQPVPLQRPGSAFQPLQARDGCPDIDLMALQPAPQASTPGMHPTSNYCFQAGNQEPNDMQNMHSLPVGAGFNGYHQPLPNAWYSQPSPNVAGAAFQGMPAGQASHQVPPQLPQAYGSIAGGPLPEMPGNQTPQPFVNANQAAPWGTFVDQTPHGSYQPSANMTMTAPQNSLVSQPFVNTTGAAPQVTPQAFQPSVKNTGAASWEILVDQTPHQSHQLSTNIPSAAPQQSLVDQPSQPPVNIARATPRGRSVNQAANKGSPEVPPQALQSSTNVTGTTPRGTLGNQTPHGSHQPSTNTAATGPQKSTDCQPSKSTVENTGAAHCGTLGSQSSHESHQSFTNRAITALQQILDNQSPRRSVSATGAATQGEPISQASHGSHQPSINTAVTAPQKSLVIQPSQPVAGLTGAAPQERPVGHNGLEVHSRIHGSRVNGVRKSTTAQSPTTSRGRKKSEKKNPSPTKTQPQKSCPPPPPAKDILKQNECISWEADMARHLHNSNVMGLYKIGDYLCDVHAASGDFVKLARRGVTPDGEYFWRHTILGQRIHSVGAEHLNGRIVCSSNGAFIGMEDSQGNMIVPKWQFTDPVDLESKSKERKDQSESKELKDQSESKELKNQSEFKKLKEALKNWRTTLKKETAAISGLKPGCDPMWF
ncbi:hypothetical protein NCS57_00043600 [Fusarium keratoplasticum]|uniref:Uncharacterized protein n=1 Tax=Fusarium keratoplasticum TaxID=1328300 RepID=A0ACC0RC32_9HYPO|nr:hypothetical protein NCS57_00043600 [Fusarium keratoplasticum]KAI8683788.1 hypothetical protein NCS57_00043600 [Fusarium keratoplasticum]KAI8687904.1 hypothetical protein NCS55_00042700 [Fusarium keratoplasticum]